MVSDPKPVPNPKTGPGPARRLLKKFGSCEAGITIFLIVPIIDISLVRRRSGLQSGLTICPAIFSICPLSMIGPWIHCMYVFGLAIEQMSCWEWLPFPATYLVHLPC
ncbi:hypothetical protein SCLCIDRAFT_960248 [Scleroderma citrinum Foug A]|uniref:Uncharacterized protein n=1 Tax=Scleroderma citrinum Foug A TaxID=1036808 RepID=A0A0C3DVS4_9AGAM|nr:hypothetical protein SCLCIDRAFT_960248 [Scleroderma citrinum Foug A]